MSKQSDKDKFVKEMKKRKKQWVVPLNPQDHVICTNGDIEVTLEGIHIGVLHFLDIWMKGLINRNGGYGEVTFEVKEGVFRSASATETYRNIEPLRSKNEKHDETP